MKNLFFVLCMLTVRMAWAAECDYEPDNSTHTSFKAMVEEIRACLYSEKYFWVPDPGEMIVFSRDNIPAHIDLFYNKVLELCMSPEYDGKAYMCFQYDSDIELALYDKGFNDFERAFLKYILCQYASPEVRKDAFLKLYSTDYAGGVRSAQGSTQPNCALLGDRALDHNRVLNVPSSIAHLFSIDGCYRIFGLGRYQSCTLQGRKVTWYMVLEDTKQVLELFRSKYTIKARLLNIVSQF